MPTFNKSDLTLIDAALTTHIEEAGRVSVVAATALRARVRLILQRALDAEKKGTDATVIVTANPDDDRDDRSVLDAGWIKEADDLVEGLVYSSEEKLRVAREAREATERHVAKLEAKIDALKDVELIQRENERLRLELTIKGPQDAEEREAALKKRVATLQAEAEVHQRQIYALKTALSSERHDRQIYEESVQPILREARLQLGVGDMAKPPAALPEEDWTCPSCGRSHRRGHFYSIGCHRCLWCGYSGSGGVMTLPEDPDPSPFAQAAS